MNRKKRCDFFYFVAKKFKFRSRAAFKLIEIEKKFNFLKKSSGIIDLCAAPGSWMQVSRRLAPAFTPVIGIDICPIRMLDGCKILIGDITSYCCFNSVLKLIISIRQQVATVLHDGSPKIEAKWTTDVYKQNKLVLSAFKFTQEILTHKGWFVTKVFRSRYFNNLICFLKNFFKRIFVFKPIASRNESVEIYLVCEEHLKILKRSTSIRSGVIFKNSILLNLHNFSAFLKKTNSIIHFSDFLESIQKKNLFCLITNYKYEKEQSGCLFGTYFYGLNISNSLQNKKFIIHISTSISWYNFFFK